MDRRLGLGGAGIGRSRRSEGDCQRDGHGRAEWKWWLEFDERGVVKHTAQSIIVLPAIIALWASHRDGVPLVQHYPMSRLDCNPNHNHQLDLTLSFYSESPPMLNPN